MRPTALFLGCLVLAVSSLDGQQSGLPVLSPAPPEASCTHAAIACGGSVTGSIEETDCKVANGMYADVYAIEIPDKRFLTIQMDSSELDSFLIFREKRGMQDIPVLGNMPAPLIAPDDNSGGGKNARVEVGAETPGTWFITARGKKRGSLGAYTLTVQCEALTCRPSGVAVCLGRMRFRVMARYTDIETVGFGASGIGERVTFQATGPPMNFRPGSAEVSVTDHCAEDGHFRVSATAKVDGPFRITVTDTKTGAERVYESKPGEAFPPVEDRQAFPCR